MTPPIGTAASAIRRIDAAPRAADRFADHVDELIVALTMARSVCAEPVGRAAALIAGVLRHDGAVLTCGNGGSAAQAQHFAAELVGRMGADRPALRATSLTADAAVVTALGNDYGYDAVFARQIEALGRPGDVLVAFSVSGRSSNVLRAIDAAAGAGMATVLVTGASFAPTNADVVVGVPSPTTSYVQEIHLAVTHAVSEAVEVELFGGPARAGS